jgi:hypothetical protein
LFSLNFKQKNALFIEMFFVAAKSANVWQVDLIYCMWQLSSTSIYILFGKTMSPNNFYLEEIIIIINFTLFLPSTSMSESYRYLIYTRQCI